jgi:uncharacterized protein YraI
MPAKPEISKRFSVHKMHTIRPLVLLALLAGFPDSAAWAEADGPDYYQVQGVAKGDTLNIRAQPKSNAAKLGEIPANGTCVRNLGCKGGLSFKEYSELTPAQQAKRTKQNPRWCKVEYQGVTGWVAGRYLREGACQ